MIILPSHGVMRYHSNVIIRYIPKVLVNHANRVCEQCLGSLAVLPRIHYIPFTRAIYILGDPKAGAIKHLHMYLHSLVIGP